MYGLSGVDWHGGNWCGVDWRGGDWCGAISMEAIVAGVIGTGVVSACMIYEDAFCMEATCSVAIGAG